MAKILTLNIEKCKECIHAGLYYTNPSMVYRNRCEYPGVRNIRINDGLGIIPDDCPLDNVPDKKGEI